LGGACGIYGGVHKYRVAIIRLAEMRQSGRNRDRLENKNPQEPEEIKIDFVEWTDLAQYKKK